ncbi:MAG: hypothetical protein IJS22_08350 [Lachnospiraceae bacterium]|nr:hypothetical protein [Lachnospiraceae bacterium]
MIKFEAKKTLLNRLFVFSMLISLCVALLSAINNIHLVFSEREYYRQAEEILGASVNPDYPAYSLYNFWIGEDFGTFLSSLFFFLFPILSSAPSIWIFFTEKKSGYIKSICTRTGLGKMYMAKYIVSFLSGGAAIAIPMTVNFIVVAMFVPAVTPDIYYDTYYTVVLPSMFSSLFYSAPLAYVILRIILAFFFGGCLAVLGFSLVFCVSRLYIALLLPFLSVLAVHYGESIIPERLLPGELSPVYIVSAHGFLYKTLWVAICELASMLIISIIIYLLKGKKKDVF